MNLPPPPAAVIAWDPETGEPSRRAEPWPSTDACHCDSGLAFEVCCGDDADDAAFYADLFADLHSARLAADIALRRS